MLQDLGKGAERHANSFPEENPRWTPSVGTPDALGQGGMEAAWNGHLGTKRNTLRLNISSGFDLLHAGPWRGTAGFSLDPLRFLRQPPRARPTPPPRRRARVRLCYGRFGRGPWTSRRSTWPDPSVRAGHQDRAGFAFRDAPEGSQALHPARQRTRTVYCFEPAAPGGRQLNRPDLNPDLSFPYREKGETRKHRTANQPSSSLHTPSRARTCFRASLRTQWARIIGFPWGRPIPNGIKGQLGKSGWGKFGTHLNSSVSRSTLAAPSSHRGEGALFMAPKIRITGRISLYPHRGRDALHVAGIPYFGDQIAQFQM
jgi:hypothetical protein